eukprot:437923-Hanusia_phi.AAC.5
MQHCNFQTEFPPDDNPAKDLREMSSEKLSRAEKLELWRKEKQMKVGGNKPEVKSRVLKDINVNHPKTVRPKDTPRPNVKTEKKTPTGSSNFKQHHQKLHTNRARNVQAPIASVGRCSMQKRTKSGDSIKSCVEKLYSGIRDIQEMKEAEKEEKTVSKVILASDKEQEAVCAERQKEVNLFEEEGSGEKSKPDSDIGGRCDGPIIGAEIILDSSVPAAGEEKLADVQHDKEEDVAPASDCLSPAELAADTEDSACDHGEVTAAEDPLSSTRVKAGPSSGKHQTSPISEHVDEDLDSEDGEDVERLRLSVFRLSHRLARCTSLLQEAVRENADLKHQLALNEGFKIRYEALENTMKEMQMLQEARSSGEERLAGAEEEGVSRKRVGADLSPAKLSPKRYRTEQASPTTSSERVRLLTERIVAQDKEIVQLRKAVKGKDGAFSQERKTLIERLRVVDEQRREAETALDENDLMWQQLFNNQMEQLKKKVQGKQRHCFSLLPSPLPSSPLLSRVSLPR